ncbi:hypothetical protein AAF712_015003 [Marasmius tenuissimus]|uniref:Uncharacterized protein n=1 Tax=Marasmius tenuissimus TaxID=585030 RepID=A0ABR2Z9I1_9AGAR
MGYDIFVSEDLHADHPSLLASLQSLFADNSEGEDVDIAVLPGQLPGVKTVQWGHGFHTLQPSLTLLWLSLEELDTHIRNNSLTTFIDEFWEHFGQPNPSQHTTLLLLFGHGSSFEDQARVELEMCRMEVQYCCLHRKAASEHEAAVIIHTYTRGLWKMIASPSPQECFEIYLDMLLTIPAMTPERAALVTSCHRNPRSLHEALRAVENEVRSGEVILNRSLVRLY